MDDKIVIVNGVWWTKDDGSGNEENAPGIESCCFDLTTNCPDEPNMISSLVPTKGIMIQAGGNVGYFTKKYADIFQFVYTFEPIPELFHCLNRNIQKDNVFKFQACLGEKHGCVSLGRKISNNAGSLNVTGVGMTPTMRIDDLALPGCDLIQLDLEGYELFALKGGVDTIKRYKPVIVIEVCHGQRYGISPEMIDAWFDSIGYKRARLMNQNIMYAFQGQSAPKHHPVFSALKL
jgi:FkbM family methyltransferase